jgi:hypothetical protein
MPTRRGEILEHGDRVEPALHSTHLTVRGQFMHRAMSRRFRTPLKHQHPRGTIVRTPGPTARQAVVKVWQPTPKTTGRHLTYLTHDGTDGPGRRAELFSEAGQPFNRQAFVKTAHTDPGQYRLMISVRDHGLVSYQVLTKAFMAWVQTEVLRARVEWVAAVHLDTPAHPHVHLLIRGVDANGQEVHFTHDTRLQSMRYQVQNLVTRWLGPTHTPAADVAAMEAWADAHFKEATAMQDPMPDADPSAAQAPPLRPNILTPEEAQRRLDATRQRIEQTVARLQARGQDVSHAKAIEPETLQHQPGEPEHSQSPDQQSTPTQGMEL